MQLKTYQVHAEDPVQRMQRSNSDTLVDSAVTVYAIHI